MTEERARHILAMCDAAATQLVRYNAQVPEWHRLLNAHRGNVKRTACGLA